MKTFRKILFYPLAVIITLAFTNCSKDVDSLMLNETNKYLSIGDTLQIGYMKVEPEDKDYEVSWSSSNDEVASVNSKGLVIAKSEGHAFITATCRKESAVCEINVVKYGFRSATVFETNTPPCFYFVLSTGKSKNLTMQEPKPDVLFIFDLMLPQDSINIVKGEYIAGNENSAIPYFTPGQRIPDIKGSYIVEKETNDTLPITGGKFSVSTPDKLYFILGAVETERGNISFIYEGSIPAKNVPIDETGAEEKSEKNP